MRLRGLAGKTGCGIERHDRFGVDRRGRRHALCADNAHLGPTEDADAPDHFGESCRLHPIAHLQLHVGAGFHPHDT